jgi:hypothetical protein
LAILSSTSKLVPKTENSSSISSSNDLGLELVRVTN